MELWYPGATRIATLAAGRPMASADAVIVHIMQGYRSTMDDWARLRGKPGDADGAPKQSTHFAIDRAGGIAQYIPINLRAWSAGRLDPGRQPTWSKYLPKGGNPNARLMAIECEGFSAPPSYGYDYIYGNSHPWPDALLASLAEVSAWGLYQFGLEANDGTLIGHYEIAPVSRAHDPGPAFPWDAFRERVASELAKLAPADAPADAPAPVTPATVGPHHEQHQALEDKDNVLATNISELTKRVETLETRVSGASDALRAG